MVVVVTVASASACFVTGSPYASHRGCQREPAHAWRESASTAGRNLSVGPAEVQPSASMASARSPAHTATVVPVFAHTALMFASVGSVAGVLSASTVGVQGCVASAVASTCAFTASAGRAVASARRGRTRSAARTGARGRTASTATATARASTVECAANASSVAVPQSAPTEQCSRRAVTALAEASACTASRHGCVVRALAVASAFTAAAVATALHAAARAFVSINGFAAFARTARRCERNGAYTGG